MVTQYSWHLSFLVSRNKNRQKISHVGPDNVMNTFQHGGRMSAEQTRKLLEQLNRRWTETFVDLPLPSVVKVSSFECGLSCRMSQNEILMPNYDLSNSQQVTHCHNVAVRGRRFIIPTQGRSKAFQLNIKMMNFSKGLRRKRSSRGRNERYNSGPHRSRSENEKGCVKRSVVGDSNGPQNSCVRDILWKSAMLETS